MPSKKNTHRETFFALTISVVFFCGCSTVSIVSNQSSHADDTFNTTEVALFWGLSDPVVSVECGETGLQFVSARTNWLYSLCSVVTLGAVVPVEMEYRCTSTPMHNGGPIGEAGDLRHEH